jgi:hypothetical protein
MRFEVNQIIIAVKIHYQVIIGVGDVNWNGVYADTKLCLLLFVIG